MMPFKADGDDVILMFPKRRFCLTSNIWLFLEFSCHGCVIEFAINES